MLAGGFLIACYLHDFLSYNSKNEIGSSYLSGSIVKSAFPGDSRGGQAQEQHAKLSGGFDEQAR
jgi:hypothetical protein